MTHVSLIIPAYQRIAQTLRTIQLIKKSNGIETEFALECIVADSTPGDSLKCALAKHFGKSVVYTRPAQDGVAANKNQGAKIAKNEVLIFCDSDIEIEPNTIRNTLHALQKHATAAGVGGRVRWRTGPKDKSVDRPRKEDRMVKKGKTSYIEAVYSRYFATYKTVFFDVRGYDEGVFNMRGEGADLSLRYWRAGYPLVFDPSIKVRHVHNAPNSVALRVAHPEWGIAKDYVLLAYKYDMVGKAYPNFNKTIYENFKCFKKEACYRVIQAIVFNGTLLSRAFSLLDEQKKELKKDRYDFKFLEVFSDEKLFFSCISSAKATLASIRAKAFLKPEELFGKRQRPFPRKMP